MKHLFSKLCALALLLLALGADSALAASAPRIDKTSVVVWARTLNLDKRGWLPLLNFRVLGPVPAGTRFNVQYSDPKGKPWISYDLTCNEVPEGGWWEYDRSGIDVEDAKATAQVGLFGLKITMINELEGKNELLFDGKIDAKKYMTQFKKPDFYVDQEWRLPFGYAHGDWLEQSYGTWAVNKAPSFMVDMWFRGEPNNLQGFLFYNGKKVATSQSVNQKQSYRTLDESPYLWSMQVFWISSVKVFLNEEVVGNYPDAHVLAKNPGDYELKVLQDGKLVRTMKFSVGADGAIVNNGACDKLNCNNQKMFPIQFTGGAKASADAAKGAFFGNPVEGLVIK